MAIASNSRTQILIVPEVTMGTTPATPTMVETPTVSSSLNLTKTLISSAAAVASRRKKFSRHGNTAVSGDIAGELSFGQFDPLIESVMCSPFTADIARIGTTKKSLSIQIGSLDVSQYQLFKGCVVNTMSVEVAQDAIIGLSFGIIGMTQTTSTTTAATTVTPALSSEPMVHKEGTISIDGTMSAIVTSFNLVVDNGYQAIYAIGSSNAVDIPYGSATVSGNMTLYFEDVIAYNRFLNETQVAVTLVTLDPAGNKYTWLMPNVQFNTGAMSTGGNGPRTITMSFEALDEATHGPLEITRDPA
ncbi:phage tail tube protein [Variovorax sp. J22R193]|uniref:phage tail tube protein n=1 Tax=Variovorax fucosicus TaxID=3053517 RepID=UPI002574C551|nr:phage tail tube protein [Variovorax sp. J22R193]MDM0042144.1 phage tail tube protein [Variovorax sp. J22R193]